MPLLLLTKLTATMEMEAVTAIVVAVLSRGKTRYVTNDVATT